MAQYIARNVDNTPKVPQPGDVEVQDVFTNVFDNFNEYGTNPGQVRFYNVENTLKSPQPLYQNGNYKRYIVQSHSSCHIFFCIFVRKALLQMSCQILFVQ